MLEIGDVVLTTYGYGDVQWDVFGRVERVTKTQAIIGANRFSREIHPSGRIHGVRRDTFSQRSYFVATPERLALVKLTRRRYQVRKALEKVTVDDLTVEQCDSIIDFLSKCNTKEEGK